MSHPIADYALLGDCHSAALVSRDGSVDWWCAPRFDSRSLCARLLDPDAGHFSIRPAGAYEVQCAYVQDTMVLRTTFRTATGAELRLTDALALEPGARGHDIGLRSPHVLLRLAEVTRGRVEVEVEFAPRPEYGLVVPELRLTSEGLRTIGGPDSLVLSTDAAMRIEGATARAVLVLEDGESTSFSVAHHSGLARTGSASLDARAAIADTVEGWRSWVGEHTRYDGAYAEQVNRSALVLQALTYGPSGAVVAAPTTSLPEIAGGESNWDYRYAWLRDAALTLRALWVAACPSETRRYFDWMARAVGQSDGHVQIMFGVEGERDLTEHELDHLDGYAGSRPVRIGNDAWRQRQLDVMGEVLEAAHVLRDELSDLDESTASFLAGLADRAAEQWQDTDAGIWEGREGERHYTSSKLLCWVALDRAIALAPLLRAGRERVEAWTAARDDVRAAILDGAWHEGRGAYTGAFGSDRLDASVLLMPILGFIAAGDERMRATITAIEDELSDDGLVRRWSGGDPDEGAFAICSFWLASCLADAGELERARRIFERVAGHANDLGLLAEEIDPRDGALLGNFPQAFSHVGLITAAWSIDRAAATQSPQEAPA